MHQIPINLEDSSLYLSCAIKNLNILLEGIQHDLAFIEKTGKFYGVGNLQAYCDAMYSAIRALDYLQDNMDTAIEAAYTKGDCI